jgi:proline racemase
LTQRLRTIDAHVGGQAVRLIVEGLSESSGRSLASRRDRLARHGDYVRRALLRPPRGETGLVAALLSEPLQPGAHAALLCMDGDGYPPLQGGAVIAAATIALQRGLIFVGDLGPETRLVFDTLAGTVVATARVEQRGDALRVDSVAFTNVPSFVIAAAQPVFVGGRELRVDIAYGGVFHAIIDTEAIGIPLEGSRIPELRRLAMDLLKALNAAGRIEHPVDGSLSGVTAVTITAAPRDLEAHLRNVTISAGGAVDPSPSVTGTSAAMSILDAMGLLPEDQPFVHEGIAGALLRGRVLRRTQVGDRAAVVTEITGTAWITGDHTFVLDEDDPLREGFTF